MRQNWLLVLFTNSAAFLAAVFFWILSHKLKTIWLIWVFKESISPLALTAMNLVKSPSITAAETGRNHKLAWSGYRHRLGGEAAEDCKSHIRIKDGREVRNFLPYSLNVPDFGLHSQVSFGSGFTSDLLDLGSKDG